MDVDHLICRNNACFHAVRGSAGSLSGSGSTLSAVSLASKLHGVRLVPPEPVPRESETWLTRTSKQDVRH